MKKIRLILCAALMILSINALPQTIIEGLVKDAKSGEAIPFVNIALVGETIGTISDENGEFKLSIANTALSKNLAFSSVGYTAKTLKISELVNQRNEISLDPADIKIEEVVVTDKSEAGKKLLRSALQKLETNFIHQPYSYLGTYTSTVKKGGKENVTTMRFTAYDSEGYVNNPVQTAYQALNYKITQCDRNFKANDYDGGTIRFDIANGFDVMRYKLNFINEEHFSDFDYRIKQDGGDANTALIEFTCNNLNLLSTGALNPKKYTGTILVDKTTFDVKSCSYTLIVSNFTPHSLSMESAEPNNAEITAKVEYQKNNNYTSLKAVTSQIKVNQSGNETVYTDKINVESANYKIPTKVDGKVFYVR